MTNSPQEGEPSSQMMISDYESSQDLQALSSTIAPAPEAPSDQSLIPSRYATTLPKVSAEILQAIESQHWETMLELVNREVLISKPRWWVLDEDIPANYQGAKGECLESLHIIFDESLETKIANAVATASEGNFPVHGMTEFITKSQESLSFEQIKRSISILSGFGRSEYEHLQKKNSKGRNALHIAALGEGRNSERALSAVLELMALSASKHGLAGLDEKDGDGNTALHVAALNIPKTALHLSQVDGSKRHESTQPFNRLLRAGANPWIQNGARDTVLHLLNKDRQANNNDGKSESNIQGTAEDNTSIQNLREIMRIQAARDILRQQGDWKPQLVAANDNDETAMSLALSAKDYKMVEALVEASQTPSFVLKGKEQEDTWSQQGAAAFEAAVLNRDTNLDPMRGNLIGSLAEDQFVKKCFNKRDNLGLTALHKVCNLEEDRDDIVMALLKNGAKTRSRVGQPAQQHSKEFQRYIGWTALSFALERGHRWTVSLLLANGAMDELSPAEWSAIRQRTYEGNYICWDLIQYFRTHVSDNFNEVLVRPSECKDEKELGFLAIKWPSKGNSSQNKSFKDFDYSSYPDKRPVGHMIYGNDDTSWDTWTRRNGGWIHLPANNVSIHHHSLTRKFDSKTNTRPQ